MDFLVIDDDKTFRDATCLLIDSEGHYAQGVCSGELGLTELKEGKFDSVLLDLNLGPEKGLDILEQIRKVQPNLPVVIFTAPQIIASRFAQPGFSRRLGRTCTEAAENQFTMSWCRTLSPMKT